MNPIKVDPTGTSLIRKKAEKEMLTRIDEIRKNLVLLVAEEDAFGLRPPQQGLVLNTRWEFQEDPEKVDSFKVWLKDQVDQNLLAVEESTAQPWLARHIFSTYRLALAQGFTKVRNDLPVGSPVFLASQEQFLNQAFGAPVTRKQLQLLYTRAYDQLQGFTSTMSTDASRILASGLAHGTHPRRLAKQMSDQIKEVSRPQALRIVRTEIINSHAEATLDSFELLGVDLVGLQAEYTTAGDVHVCKRCEALEGIVLTISQARGLIPRHPNCRCAWAPANFLNERKFRGRSPKKTKKATQDAIKRSLLAERKKEISVGRAKGLTQWPGKYLIKGK